MPLLTKIIMDVSLIHPWGIGRSVLILLSLELANDHILGHQKYGICFCYQISGLDWRLCYADTLQAKGQNLPEDGSHFFRQIACQQHSELPIHLSPEFAAQMSITVATCWRQLCVELLFFSVHRLVVSDFVKFIHTKIPWNLENLNSTRNPQVR